MISTKTPRILRVHSFKPQRGFSNTQFCVPPLMLYYRVLQSSVPIDSVGDPAEHVLTVPDKADIDFLRQSTKSICA
jgi:hypothetical protein